MESDPLSLSLESDPQRRTLLLIPDVVPPPPMAPRMPNAPRILRRASFETGQPANQRRHAPSRNRGRRAVPVEMPVRVAVCSCGCEAGRRHGLHTSPAATRPLFTSTREEQQEH